MNIFNLLDCLIFRHSHGPVKRVQKGVLHFNPGSAACDRFFPFNSVGILGIGKTISGEIIELRED